MQLDATARTPSIVQAKSRACGNLDIAQTAIVGVARCFVTPVIDERHLKPHSPVLPVTNARPPQTSKCPRGPFCTVLELVPLCVQPYARRYNGLIIQCFELVCGYRGRIDGRRLCRRQRARGM